jgi:hypothetical protein
MSAGFVKVLQTFAIGLNASNPEHQEMARRMIKTLADEPPAQSKPSVVRRSTQRPRPAQLAPHLVSG